MFTKTRRAAALASAVLLSTVGLLVALTSPASAATVDALCTGGQDVLTFDPALGLLQQPTDFEIDSQSASTCLVGPSTVTLQSSSGSGNLSCTVNTGLTGTSRYDWSSGADSIVQLSGFVAGINQVSKLATISGTVTSGQFAGDSVEIVYLSTGLFTLVDCLNGALDEADFQVVAITFTDL